MQLIFLNGKNGSRGRLVEALYIRQEKTKLEPWLYKRHDRLQECQRSSLVREHHQIVLHVSSCSERCRTPRLLPESVRAYKSLREGEKHYVPFLDRLSLHHSVFSVNSHFESKGLRERDRHFK